MELAVDAFDLPVDGREADAQLGGDFPLWASPLTSHSTTSTSRGGSDSASGAVEAARLKDCTTLRAIEVVLGAPPAKTSRTAATSSSALGGFGR